MYYGQFSMFLLLVFLIAINSANVRTVRFNFPFHTSLCLDIVNDTQSRCIIVENKIKCEKTKCVVEEKVKRTKDFNFETKFTDIKASFNTTIICDNADQMFYISDVIYLSPKAFGRPCSDDRECLAENLKNNYCFATPFCNHYGSKPFCKDSHLDVASKLQLECLTRKETCNVQVPRRMIKNYETCVDKGNGAEVVCTDESNYCYAKLAEVKYYCISPGMHNFHTFILTVD